MLKHRVLVRRTHRVRRYFHAGHCRFLAVRRRPVPTTPDISASTVQSGPLATPRVQIRLIEDLFPATLLQLDHLSLKQKYGSGRKRSKSKKKKGKRTRGLQYKLKYWRGVQGKERERKYTTHSQEEEPGNDARWSRDDIRSVAIVLLDRSLEQVAQRGSKDSSTIAEIVAWIQRRYDDSGLTFDSCCAVAGYDADDLRSAIMALLKRRYGSSFPHYRVLRNGVIDAESGHADAIAWVLSDATTPLSFVDCVRALGFEPTKARDEILLPAVTESIADMVEEDQITRIDDPNQTTMFVADCA